MKREKLPAWSPWLLWVLFTAILPSLADAQEEESLSLLEAVTKGRPLVQIRSRYAHIDEDAKQKYTDALTVRATLGWQSAPFHDFRFLVQGIHTDYFGSKRFNDNAAQIPTSPYPLLPDPRNTDFNQLYVDYTGVSSTRIRLGKQILRLDNQRFISDDDFRQTPRVFNGLTVVNNSLPNTELMAGHMQRVRNVFGQQSRLRLNILHAAYNPAPNHSLAGYGYFHDQAATGSFTGFADNSYRILGLRAAGGFSVSEAGKLLYAAEYAQQDPYADGDKRINARYFRVGGGPWWPSITARLDYEVKGSDHGIYGFQTPLTDLYAHNGLALQFVSTPTQGLRDRWITVAIKAAKLDVLTEYHSFRADSGGFDFGRELDVTTTYPIRPNLTVRLQHANYRPGDPIQSKRDVEKTWLTLNYNY